MFNVNKKKPQANVQRTIRFDEELHHKINELAEKEDVSFNHFVLECCRYALEEYDPFDQDDEDHNKEIKE